MSLGKLWEYFSHNLGNKDEHWCQYKVGGRKKDFVFWLRLRYRTAGKFHEEHDVVLGKKKKKKSQWDEKDLHWLIFMLIYSKPLCFHDWINWIDKLTLKDNTVSLCFIFFYIYKCIHVADPATFLASNSVLGTLFFPGNNLFIIHGKDKHFRGYSFKGARWNKSSSETDFIFIFFYVKRNKQTSSICFYDWVNEINKLTLKDATISYCFIGEPCHLSSFKQCSYFCLVYSVMEGDTSENSSSEFL